MPLLSDTDLRRAMTKYAPVFRIEEFVCRHCGEVTMHTDFLDKLYHLRDALSWPMKVSSGYRCPLHNKAVSSTGLNGPHTTGRAADIEVSGLVAYHLIRLAFEAGITGIGVSQKGVVKSRFIHLDDIPVKSITIPRPRIWSY